MSEDRRDVEILNCLRSDFLQKFEWWKASCRDGTPADQRRDAHVECLKAESEYWRARAFTKRKHVRAHDIASGADAELVAKR